MKILLFALLFVVSCQTPAHEKFANLKLGMTKDDVLEVVGSPNRTEYAYSTEKWAYRFWVGDDRNTEDLRQVTFVQGKVTSFGVDESEIKRLREIREYDLKRAELAKAKEKLESAGAVVPLGETPKSSDFRPMTGTTDKPTSAQ